MDELQELHFRLQHGDITFSEFLKESLEINKRRIQKGEL